MNEDDNIIENVINIAELVDDEYECENLEDMQLAMEHELCKKDEVVQVTQKKTINERMEDLIVELNRLHKTKESAMETILTLTEEIINEKSQINYNEAIMWDQILNAIDNETGKPMYSNKEKRDIAFQKKKDSNEYYKNLERTLHKKEKAKLLNESTISSVNFALRVKEKEADLLIAIKG